MVFTALVSKRTWAWREARKSGTIFWSAVLTPGAAKFHAFPVMPILLVPWCR